MNSQSCKTSTNFESKRGLLHVINFCKCKAQAPMPPFFYQFEMFSVFSIHFLIIVRDASKNKRDYDPACYQDICLCWPLTVLLDGKTWEMNMQYPACELQTSFLFHGTVSQYMLCSLCNEECVMCWQAQ